MKEKIKYFMAGILVMCLLFSAMLVIANPQTVTRQIPYGINVVLNGEKLQFSEANRPFTMDGTTFMPLRVISETLGIAVDFDAATNTVFLGERPEIVQPPTQTVQVGDIIPFGGYDWRVLDVQANRAFIITENVIEQRAYHGNFDDWEGITWEHSTLRSYLNNQFFNSFNAADRARIAETRIVNNDNPWFGIPGGNDTTDKIFLLSLEEVVRYFGDSGQLGNRLSADTWFINDRYNTARIARNTYGNQWWWLRSPGCCSNSAASVSTDGTFLVSGPGVYHVYGGVRPALWLEL